MNNLLTKIILSLIEGVAYVGFLNIFNRISDGDKFNFEFVSDAVVPFVLWIIVSAVFYVVGSIFRKKNSKKGKE